MKTSFIHYTVTHWRGDQVIWTHNDETAECLIVAINGAPYGFGEGEVSWCSDTLDAFWDALHPEPTVKVTLHRWAGESEMTFDSLDAARNHFNEHDVASDDTIDFVTARAGDKVYMLVDDNGYTWEPCSEGPY